MIGERRFCQVAYTMGNFDICTATRAHTNRGQLLSTNSLVVVQGYTQDFLNGGGIFSMYGGQ